MKTPRPAVLIQVDLDSLWAVKAVYGLPVGRSDFEEDPLYTLGLSRLLDLFERKAVRATFFAIGRDCKFRAKRDLLQRAAETGHEIANHSHTHPIGLGALPGTEIDSEIAQASAAIEKTVGRAPVGFRAPGFDASPAVLQAVARAGLLYDSSLLPTRAGAILRGAAAFFRQKDLSGDKAEGDVSRPIHPETKPGHYGTGPVWKAPRQPYYPDLEAPWRSRALLDLRSPHPPFPSANPVRGDHPVPSSPSSPIELPVGVTARLRLPIHCSVGMAAGWTWTRRTLGRLAVGGDPVLVYVFHGIDLVGGDELTGLPAGAAGRRLFGQPLEKKRAYVERVLELLLEHFTPRVSREYLEERLRVRAETDETEGA